MVVIDLTTFKVTQVLDCKLLEVSKYIRCVVSCGNTLKELALDFIVDKVSNEKI